VTHTAQLDQTRRSGSMRSDCEGSAGNLREV
jgi:hypothetical protein